MKFESDNEQSLIKKLLVPTALPIGFKRKEPTAFRFQPYSRKIRRRLDIYSSISYDLWVHLEWNPSIELFNERVDRFPIAGAGGKIFYWAPKMVSICNRTDYWVHTIKDKNNNDPDSVDSDGEERIQVWANVNQFNLKIWTPEDIRRNPIELENRKQLYAYLSNPESVISPSVKDNVFLILRRYRKATVDDLLQSLEDKCRYSALQIVADQIMRRTIFSDIHKFPFSWTTEISCFHEFA